MFFFNGLLLLSWGVFVWWLVFGSFCLRFCFFLLNIVAVCLYVLVSVSFRFVVVVAF